MCGIAGYLHRGRVEADTSRIMAMARALRPRGPDDEGFTLVRTGTGESLDLLGAEGDRALRGRIADAATAGAGWKHDLAFAHRRFSIVDPSPAGHQPMWDAERSVCASFNGEIYNYVELRAELEDAGRRFTTSCDTEVLLQAYLAWGEECFSRFNGQWALSLYDTRRRAVLLCRDRIGKVPLYWARFEGTLAWASEIKALLPFFGKERFSVSAQAVDDFLVQGWRDLDGPFWTEVRQFPAASFAWIDEELEVSPSAYWRVPAVRAPASSTRIGDAVDEMRSLLADACRLRVRADVPVAIELSGGMDSSSIAAAVATTRPGRIKAYAMRLGGDAVDEEPYARQVAEAFPDAIDYEVMDFQEADFWTEADAFVEREEEPFLVPTLVTHQRMERRIKAAGYRVIVNGSAGDEVLAGYPWEYYIPFLKHLGRHGDLLRMFREMLLCSEHPFRTSASMLVRQTLMPRRWSAHRIRTHQLRLLGGAYVPAVRVKPRPGKSRSFDARMIENMTRWQMKYWMHSGNKVFFGIPMEVRYPFLDHRIVEFAYRLPPEFLIRDGFHKWILREAMRGLLPDSIVDRRRKTGMPFPWRTWLANSKERVARNLLDLECPWFDPKSLILRYDDLVARDFRMLWRFISFGLWWRKMIEGRPIETDA